MDIRSKNRIELKPWFGNNHIKLNFLIPLPHNQPPSSDFYNKNLSIINYNHLLPPDINIDPALVVNNKVTGTKINDKSNDIKKIQTQIKNTNMQINTKQDLKKKKLSTEKIKTLNTTLKSLNTKLKKKIENQNKHIINRPYILKFNNQQKCKIIKWMEECNRVYNYCVELHNKKAIKSYNYMKLKLIVFKKLYKNEVKPAPYDILTDAVREFCSNYKSCLSNLEAKHIKYFKLKPRNPKKVSHSICILKKLVTKNGICARELGKNNMIINNVPIADIAKLDSRLIYNKNDKNFIIKCPKYINGIVHKERKENIVALDPGGKIFQSYYGLESYGHIGEDFGKVLLRKRNKISKYQKILSKKKNKKGSKLRNKEAIKKKIRGIYKKIKNIVKDLHNKTANYLCKKAEIILIPEFGTSTMVKNAIVDPERENNKRAMKKKVKERIKEIKDKNYNRVEENKLLRTYTKEKRLRKNDKYVLSQLSHYEFKQHLIQKAEIYGCKVQIVTEEYTSQTCTLCGTLSKKYIKREKQCTHCGNKIDRDINGSRNILLKSINEMRGKYGEVSMLEKREYLNMKYKISRQ